MAIRKGQAAIRWGRARVGIASAPTSTGNWYRWCKVFVRLCFNVPSDGTPDAGRAWDRAKFKHHETNPSKIPAAVPVFWELPSVADHVAFSTGGGRCLSNDIRRRGRIDEVSIDTITRSWGGRLLGWTEDFDGVRVYTPPKPVQEPPKDDSVLRSGSSGPKVRTLQKGLRETFPAYRNDVAVKRGTLLAVDGEYGAQTKAWVQEFQRRAGLKVDGIVAAATKKALAGYGVKI